MEVDEITDEEYFAELKLMFNTKGWSLFCLELLDQAKVIDDLQMVKTTEDLHYRRGQLASIGVILNFPDTIKRAEEEQDESSQ